MGRSRWLLAAPLVAYTTVLLVYPMLYAVRLAFTDTSKTGSSRSGVKE